MSPRRSLTATLAIATALAAFGPARAQDATAPGAPLVLQPLANSSAEPPLRRLDPATLAGGDYGATPPPEGALAGGAYGQQAPAPEDVRPRPPVSTIGVGNPFARQPPLRAGSTTLRPRRPPSLDDPYAPVGVRAGSFIVRSTVDAAGGHDDNPDRLPLGGKSSSFVRLRGDVDVTSDWSRHEVRARLSGQGRRYIDLDSPGYEPEASATVDGRIDVAERTQVVTQLRTSITTSRPGDPDTPDDIKGDEIERSFGGTLGLAHRFNRFSLQLDGLADRYLFDDSKLLSGDTLDNSDRIYNAYQLRLRGAYELSPTLQPFAEITVDTRDYDQARANGGVGEDRRELGSNGYAVRGGATFEASRLVTGELAIGYGRQTPKDDGLTSAGGLLIDGNLAWTPTALTTVRLNARSSIDETTTANAGGILRRSVGLEIEHALRRNFSVTARADYEKADYQGASRIDDIIVLALEAEYRLNRSVALIGSFEHERLGSNLPGEDYKASIIEFGMRFRM